MSPALLYASARRASALRSPARHKRALLPGQALQLGGVAHQRLELLLGRPAREVERGGGAGPLLEDGEARRLQRPLRLARPVLAGA